MIGRLLGPRGTTPGDAQASEDLELLLIRRAEHPLDPWSGHIALPGGRRDPGDPDRLATMLITLTRGELLQRAQAARTLQKTEATDRMVAACETLAQS